MIVSGVTSERGILTAAGCMQETLIAASASAQHTTHTHTLTSHTAHAPPKRTTLRLHVLRPSLTCCSPRCARLAVPATPAAAAPGSSSTAPPGPCTRSCAAHASRPPARQQRGMQSRTWGRPAAASAAARRTRLCAARVREEAAACAACAAALLRAHTSLSCTFVVRGADRCHAARVFGSVHVVHLRVAVWCVVGARSSASEGCMCGA